MGRCLTLLSLVTREESGSNHHKKNWRPYCLFQIIQVTITNPSDLPVIVQILPISLYPQTSVALKALEKHDLLDDMGFTINTAVFNVSLLPNSVRDAQHIMLKCYLCLYFDCSM